MVQNHIDIARRAKASYIIRLPPLHANRADVWSQQSLPPPRPFSLSVCEAGTDPNCNNCALLTGRMQLWEAVSLLIVFLSLHCEFVINATNAVTINNCSPNQQLQKHNNNISSLMLNRYLENSQLKVLESRFIGQRIQFPVCMGTTVFLFFKMNH